MTVAPPIVVATARECSQQLFSLAILYGFCHFLGTHAQQLEPVNYLLLEASVFEPLKRMAKRIVVFLSLCIGLESEGAQYLLTLFSH